MDHLISQIEQGATGSLTDEIRVLKCHRQSLAQVIKFTLSVSRLQKSLESVLLLKRPAADIPRDLLKVLGNISDGVANLPSTELEKRLARIEETMQADMDNILGLTNQPGDMDGQSGNEHSNHVSPEMYQKLVNDFRRRANTAIVLKLHLRSRGIAVEESILPVEPETLVSQATKLAVEEKKCRERAAEELKIMDKQMEAIAFNDDLPTEMQICALELRGQIEKNINHLTMGRDIEKMPFAIDIIQMGEAEADHPDQLKKKTTKPLQTITQKVSDTNVTPMPEKNGLFARIRIWFKTPWSVKWRDTANYSGQRQ